MSIQHAVIGSFQVHYAFSGSDDCLIITTTTETDGNLLLTWMLTWRAEEGFRVEQLREDSRYGVGTRQEALVKDFPLAAAIMKIEQQCDGIEQNARRRILDLLQQAQAASTAS